MPHSRDGRGALCEGEPVMGRLEPIMCRPRRRGITSLSVLLLGAAMCLVGCESAEQGDSSQGTLLVTATVVGTPVVGQNVMAISISDAKGEPLKGAILKVDPQMPAHGHGSTEVAKATDAGDGTYKASPVTLQMKGFWRITVTATHGSEFGSTTVDLTL